jgi:hypothetical protein
MVARSGRSKPQRRRGSFNSLNGTPPSGALQGGSRLEPRRNTSTTLLHAMVHPGQQQAGGLPGDGGTLQAGSSNRLSPGQPSTPTSLQQGPFLVVHQQQQQRMPQGAVMTAMQPGVSPFMAMSAHTAASASSGGYVDGALAQQTVLVPLQHNGMSLPLGMHAAQPMQQQQQAGSLVSAYSLQPHSGSSPQHQQQHLQTGLASLSAASLALPQAVSTGVQLQAPPLGMPLQQQQVLHSGSFVSHGNFGAMPLGSLGASSSLLLDESAVSTGDSGYASCNVGSFGEGDSLLANLSLSNGNAGQEEQDEAQLQQDIDKLVLVKQLLQLRQRYKQQQKMLQLQQQQQEQLLQQQLQRLESSPAAVSMGGGASASASASNNTVDGAGQDELLQQLLALRSNSATSMERQPLGGANGRLSLDTAGAPGVIGVPTEYVPVLHHPQQQQQQHSPGRMQLLGQPSAQQQQHLDGGASLGGLLADQLSVTDEVVAAPGCMLMERQQQQHGSVGMSAALAAGQGLALHGWTGL